MAITKAAKEAKADVFIKAAPDAPRKPRRLAESRVQVTMTMERDTVAQLNNIAKEAGVSRAMLVNMAVKSMLTGGKLTIDVAGAGQDE